MKSFYFSNIIVFFLFLSYVLSQDTPSLSHSENVHIQRTITLVLFHFILIVSKILTSLPIGKVISTGKRITYDLIIILFVQLALSSFCYYYLMIYSIIFNVKVDAFIINIEFVICVIILIGLIVNLIKTIYRYIF